MKPATAPVGLKPPPRHAPRQLASTEDVRSLQRLMTHALVRPLGPGDRLPKTWIDGRPMTEVAGEFIKGNDRLSPCDRLQIYQRMYWFRLIDAVGDDSPGLRAVLGERKFLALTRAYLAKYPSRSFTLRNLSSRLAQFIREEPRWTAPRTALAENLARFEWAQTVAFDGLARPAPSAARMAKTSPAKLRLGLQPYLSLLCLDYPLDDFVIAVKKRNALRTEASNAIEAAVARRSRRVTVPRRGRIYLGVYRIAGSLYYKRIALPEFRILSALRAGQPLTRAIAAGGPRLNPARIQEWFATWTKLNWLCTWYPAE